MASLSRQMAGICQLYGEVDYKAGNILINSSRFTK